MIIIDSSETRSTSTMPSIEGAILSPSLEELTGADVCISILGAPCTNETLLKCHLKSRCILVQVKRLGDFLSSITDERINLAIAKMRAWTEAPWQRVIMSTGIFIPDLKEGDILVGEPILKDGKPCIPLHSPGPTVPFSAYDTITHRISMRGASYISLVATEALPSKLRKMEQDLAYLSGRPVKDLFFPEFFPDDPPLEDDPLQQVQPVRDGRRVLAAFEGIGPVKANAMWKAVGEWMEEHRTRLDGEKEDWLPNTLQLLVWASASKETRKHQGKVKFWGDKTYESVREQLGLSGEANLRVEILKEEEK